MVQEALLLLDGNGVSERPLRSPGPRGDADAIRLSPGVGARTAAGELVATRPPSLAGPYATAFRPSPAFGERREEVQEVPCMLGSAQTEEGDENNLCYLQCFPLSLRLLRAVPYRPRHLRDSVSLHKLYIFYCIVCIFLEKNKVFYHKTPFVCP